MLRGEKPPTPEVDSSPAELAGGEEEPTLEEVEVASDEDAWELTGR